MYLKKLTIAVGLCLATAMSAQDGWTIHAEGECKEYAGAAVGNGTIGILHWKDPFSIEEIILNNVFERRPDYINHGILGLNPFDITIYVDGKSMSSYTDWSQDIDMKNAEHRTSFRIKNKVNVSYSMMALRNLPHCALFKVSVAADEAANVKFTKQIEITERYREPRYKHMDYDANGRRIRLQQTSAETEFGRYDVSAASMFLFNESEGIYSEGGNSSNLEFKLKKGQKVEFYIIGSICSTADFSDPYSECRRTLVYAERLGPEKLIERHRELWSELWESDIEITGDIKAQEAVRLGLYNLYSSCREGTRLSVPPMGLTTVGYNGHVFWDSELWMYPPMLLLNQGIAKSMMDYRVDRIEAARKNASNHGYRGLMFPWESDAWGEESTPDSWITGPMEHHITADIAIAAWYYYCVTHDLDWLKESGWGLLKGSAEFWVSRVTANEDGTYSINEVVGADEYAINVNDNAFTNGAAKAALECAVKAAELCGYSAPQEWSRIADGLRILKDENGVTLEYDGYDGHIIKQADVNLLVHPLGVIDDPQQMERDLMYYESKVDKDGPAMTFSSFAVQYARLGNSEMAGKMFDRSYKPNQLPPFGVLAETPGNDNPYFITGAGGMLQAILFGFGGLDITENGLVQHKTILPPGWTKLVIKGVGPQKKTYIITSNK